MRSYTKEVDKLKNNSIIIHEYDWTKLAKFL